MNIEEFTVRITRTPRHGLKENIFPFANDDGTILWHLHIEFTVDLSRPVWWYITNIKCLKKYAGCMKFFRYDERFTWCEESPKNIWDRLELYMQLDSCRCGNPKFMDDYCNNCLWWAPRLSDPCPICLCEILDHEKHWIETPCCNRKIHPDCHKKIKDKNRCFWCRHSFDEESDAVGFTTLDGLVDLNSAVINFAVQPSSSNQ